MAMTIFLVLNGVGVVFLIFVLAKFWKEGHRPRSNGQKYAAQFGRWDWVDVHVVTHPIFQSAQRGLSVIPFRARDRSSGQSIHGVTPGGTPEASVRKSSTR